MLAAHFAAWLALAWASTLAWLAIGAVIRRRQLEGRFRAREAKLGPIGSAGPRVSVLLIRPCAGEDPGLFDNLCSLASAHSTLPLHVVMAVDDPSDGARSTIERAVPVLRAAGVEASFEVVPNRGANRKASILASLLDAHRTERIVINLDSNVDAGEFDFDRLLIPLLADDRLGTIWVPWAEVPVAGQTSLGSRASEALLGGSLTAFPLLCGIHPRGLVGKFWAAPRSTLDRIDFASLADYLGEDLEMAHRITRAGLRIEPASLLVRSSSAQPNFAAALERYARWMLVVRAQHLALFFTYPAFFFATPMVLTLAAVGSLARPDLAVVATGLALAARTIVTLVARRWSGRGFAIAGAAVDAVLGDLILGLAWVRALLTREVRWRGHRLRVETDGRLRALAPPSPVE